MLLARSMLVVSVFVCAQASGAIFYFTDHGAFQDFNMQDGKVLKGIETFEESSAEPGSKYPFPNPLCPGVPRPTFPNGIAEENLCIQSNITPHPLAPTPNPSANPHALFVNGVGFLGSNSIKVGLDEFLQNTLASLDLIFTPAEHTGVGFELSRYAGFGTAGWTIGIFGPGDMLLGMYVIPGPIAPEPAKVFFGVWSDIPIDRINIWGDDEGPRPFGVDNIEMWVPTPGAAGLLALSGLLIARRRRA